MTSNLPVNTDAHERPLPAVAPFRGRRLRLRQTAVKVIATHLATSRTDSAPRSDGMATRILRKILPAANPDFDGLYRDVRLWWVEVDDDGSPQRELGFGPGNQVLVAGPLEENMGFWTDSSMVFAGSEYEQVEPAAFEAYWSRFVAAWYAARAGKRNG